ncbi:Dabb family protein [Aeromonas sp. MR16]|uniref:Dabb family protein n=1 Tax=Aeromonas sp. MR16 TaxID=2923420 RepID=UPI001F4A1E5E|nr:Dabb family protein [Aeromonas sp. MR16]MCH7370969.1 Dabb family protein [Aeromonas sp. MR16]
MIRHILLIAFQLDTQAEQIEVDRQRYLPHPDHEVLKIIFRSVLERIIVLDYTPQAGDVAFAEERL